MMTFSSIDTFLIAAYFVGIILAGILYRHREEGNLDFLIAGRQLTLGAFVATLVSTFYGGILGVGEFTYRYGLISWLTQGVFYYFFAAIYAFFLAHKIRGQNHLTLPDQLYSTYGKPAGLVGTVFTFLLVSPAPYVLMIGTMLTILFQWKLSTAVIVGTLFSTIYVAFGGLRSVVKTDILQFLLMFLGFGLCLPFAWAKIGDPMTTFQQLPPQHLKLVGHLSIQRIMAWLVIAMWTIVSPSFYQRCSAAQSPAVARKGILISIAFWFLFDVMTLSAGLYARAALPEIDPIMAYPLLGNLVLPPIFKALFFIGMLATIMSTLDSLMFLSAITLGRDLLWRLRKAPAGENILVHWTRIGLGVSAFLSVGMALAVRSVIDIWYAVGSIAIPVLFLPLFTSFFPRWKLSSRQTFWQMTGTGVLATSWMLWGILKGSVSAPRYPLNLEPVYPGIFLSLLLFVLFRAILAGPGRAKGHF